MRFFKKKESNLQAGKKVNSVQTDARIKILGPGCANCKKLENNTVAALEALNVSLAVGHVEDFAEIASYGILSTPGLVIDEKVVSYGKVLSKDEIIDLIKDKL